MNPLWRIQHGGGKRAQAGEKRTHAEAASPKESVSAPGRGTGISLQKKKRGGEREITFPLKRGQMQVKDEKGQGARLPPTAAAAFKTKFGENKTVMRKKNAGCGKKRRQGSVENVF